MKRSSGRSVPAQHDYRRLFQELEILKLELEMQNCALREDRDRLQDLSTRYGTLYAFAPVAHLAIDTKGTIEELNMSCAVFLGNEPGMLQGKRLHTLIAPESHEMLDAHIRGCLDGSEPARVELMIPSIAGELRTVELVSAPPLETGGEISGTLPSVLIDVSAYKRETHLRERLLREEREARAHAERLNSVKEDFLAVVSHELRTPLVPMMMWTHALRSDATNESLRSRAIEAIDACVQAQVALIDDLLDVARALHGKLRVQRQTVDLHVIVAAALEAVAPSAASKRIRLAPELEHTPIWIAGDALRLRQVIGNLLSNAVKFTPEGGHIVVMSEARGENVVLTVRDDGEGIDPTCLHEIFEPFRQHELGPARRHGGLGLGLTIARQLVEQHDGIITAESAGKGQGSSFMVTLPRLRDRPPDGVISRPEQLPARVGVALANLRLLIIEDHPATREALQVALQAQGAAVTTAVSAADAREALGRRRPHVVVSDIGLPGEDGCTFIRRLRQRETSAREPRLPAVALSAYTTAQERSLALAAGFDRHVAKPIDFDRLVSTVQTLARGSSTTD